MANKKMRTLGRRGLSILMALIMVFSLVNITALAAEESPADDGIANLQDVYQRGDSYYIDAKIYLLYKNEVPEEIQQSFDIELFGPSGNNDPYTTVSVNLTQLLANDGVKVHINDRGHWYISCQTSPGYTAETLWAKILESMDANGQAFFADYFKNNYIGYVLKSEGDGGHIDGVYEVNPAYLTEIYIDNELKTTLFDDEAQDFNEDVLDWFESYADITWDADYTSGTFEKNEKKYSITMESKSSYDTDSGEITYTEKTTNFYVAALYYVLEDITPPPTYNYTVVAEYYTNSDKDGDKDIASVTDAAAMPSESDITNEYAADNTGYGEHTYTYISTTLNSTVYTLRYERTVETPSTPPAPETEDWTIVHNYYLNAETLEGSTSKTVTVEVGQQPAKSEYARVYANGENTYEAMGEVVIDADAKTITLNYNRVVETPPPVDPTPVDPTPVNPTPVNPTPVDPTPVTPDPDPEQTEIPEEEVPLVEIPEEEVPMVEIPEEEVPLSEIPKTGDSMMLYVILALASGIGLAWLTLSGRKTRKEEN